MIVTVTLNPALDLTYAVDALTPHGTHRVSTVAERPGGKGLNVARVLHSLGEPVLATGLLGGATGTRVAQLLATEGVAADFVPIKGETRRTVAVVDPADATGFWEPGPHVTAAEWSRFVAHFRALLTRASVVTLCGSLPPGVPLDGYATLIRLATASGVRTVLDTSGAPLREGLLAAPTLAKPNADEFAVVATAAHRSDLVISRGPDGLLAKTRKGTFTCTPPARLTGNPTGAGDACVAALARGLRDHRAWPSLLTDAVALSAAAVASPVAGAIDPDTYHRIHPQVTVTQAPDPTTSSDHHTPAPPANAPSSTLLPSPRAATAPLPPPVTAPVTPSVPAPTTPPDSAPASASVTPPVSASASPPPTAPDPTSATPPVSASVTPSVPTSTTPPESTPASAPVTPPVSASASPPPTAPGPTSATAPVTPPVSASASPPVRASASPPPTAPGPTSTTASVTPPFPTSVSARVMTDPAAVSGGSASVASA